MSMSDDERIARMIMENEFKMGYTPTEDIWRRYAKTLQHFEQELNEPADFDRISDYYFFGIDTKPSDSGGDDGTGIQQSSDDSSGNIL